MQPVAHGSIPPDEMEAKKPVSDSTLLVFVLAGLLLANVGQWALARALHWSNPGGLKQDALSFLHVRQWTDSWLPMMKSLDYWQAHPGLPIYSAHLYDTLIYSLASLLPLLLLRKLGMGDAMLLRTLAVASWLAVAGTAMLLVLLAKRLLRERGCALTWTAVAAMVLATMGCYPLLKGYALGNAQTFLSFGFAGMLLLWTMRHERAAGAVAAVLALVKPQYGLLLLWMALRRRWGAAAAFCVTAVVLLLIAVAVFGWRNNFDYLGVLASLSHKAQSHFANQSMFGTLNRMIFNGENIGYTPHVYTPYVAWVYRTTVATSLLLTALALFFPWGALRGTSGDLGAMGLISVAASPMAWEHHYGIVLGIFCWTWFALLKWRGYGVAPRWMLTVAFFLCTNFLALTNLLAYRRGWNVLQSYMYFGALLLVATLMLLARRVSGGVSAETRWRR